MKLALNVGGGYTNLDYVVGFTQPSEITFGEHKGKFQVHAIMVHTTEWDSIGPFSSMEGAERFITRQGVIRLEPDPNRKPPPNPGGGSR